MTSTVPILIPTPPRLHEHGWSIESRHATSEGWIVYVRCAGCDARRVDIEQVPAGLPSALSRPVRS